MWMGRNTGGRHWMGGKWVKKKLRSRKTSLPKSYILSVIP